MRQTFSNLIHQGFLMQNSIKSFKNPNLKFNKIKNLIQKNKTVKVLIGVLCILIILLVSYFLFFANKKPKTYDDYMKNIEEVKVIDEYSSMVSGAYRGLEEQIGADAYDALVLGDVVEEGSVYYQTQQNNLGAAKNEADHARALVLEHEAQIREMGGIVSPADLARVDTGQVTDPMARAKITGKYAEYINDLRKSENGDLEAARRAAAYE